VSGSAALFSAPMIGGLGLGFGHIPYFTHVCGYYAVIQSEMLVQHLMLHFCVKVVENFIYPFVCLQLQSRFQAAQNQIKELHRRLEQMEMQVCFP